MTEDWAVPTVGAVDEQDRTMPGGWRDAEPGRSDDAGQGGSHAVRRPAWDAGSVRGAKAVTLVCTLCFGALAIVNTAALLGLVTVQLVLEGIEGAASGGLDGFGFLLLVVGMALGVALVPILVLGWPAGAGLAWLLRDRPREREHVLAFALVGAVLAVVVMAVGGATWGSGGVALAVAAVEGALGAGGGRWWAGRVLRCRAERAAALAWPAPTGAVGPTGAVVLTGAVRPTGAVWTMGEDGTTGAGGTTGAVGTAGVVGTAGAVGSTLQR